MARLASAELPTVKAGASDRDPEDENDNDDGADKIAGIINSASLSGSGQKDTGKVTDREAGGTVTNRFFKRVSDLFPIGRPKPLTAVDESNISRKRTAVEETNHEDTEVIPELELGTTVAYSKELSRPNTILTDIGKSKPRSSGRPDPYSFEPSPSNPASESQSGVKPVIKKRGLKLKNSKVGKGKDVIAAQGQVMVEAESHDVSEEGATEEDHESHSERNSLKRKRSISFSVAEPSPSPKSASRSSPASYSVAIERTVHTRNSEETGAVVSVESTKPKRKQGRPRKGDAPPQVEEISSPATTVESEGPIAPNGNDPGESLAEITERDLTPDSGEEEGLFVTEGENARENPAENGENLAASESNNEYPEGDLTRNQINSSPSKPRRTLKAKKSRLARVDKSKAMKLSGPRQKVAETSAGKPDNWVANRRKSKPSSQSPEKEKKKRKPIGNRQVEDKEDYEKAFQERQERMRAGNTHLKQHRNLLNTLHPASQEGQLLVRGQEQLPLPNSSQLRAPSTSQLPDPRPSTSTPLPSHNRTPFVHPLQTWKEEHERQLKERTRQMQEKNSFFKREREIFGLPHIGSQQRPELSRSQQTSVFNSSRARAPSSSQIPDAHSSSPRQFSSSEYRKSELPSIGNRARQIQRDLAALVEEDRLVAEKRERLQRELLTTKEMEARSGEPFDSDERVHMFGGGKSPASIPKKWARGEMAILIEGLRANQGPDRYEKIRLSLPDMNYDEIFDQAKYFKDSMVEKHKEKQLNDPLIEDLEPFIESIGLESRAN